MTRSKLFTSNKSQAVRLPKPVAFPPGVEQVEIIKVGNSRIIVPVGARWTDWFRDGPRFSEDFMQDRVQGDYEEREPL